MRLFRQASSTKRKQVPRLLIVCAIAMFPANLLAVPPKLDYLFPAGGQRGTTVEVSAGGVLERWPVSVHVDGEGVAVKPGKTSGKLTVAIAKDAAPGPCWIRLHDHDGASIARPFIVGLLPEVMEQEPNDDPKKPHPIEKLPIVVNGRLEKNGEVDTFAVTLTKGQTLVASLEAHRTLRSPMDGVMQILSADGFVLEQNDDYHGLDPQIAFTAPKDGKYLVRLFAFPAIADSSITFAGKETFIYRLTLTTGPFVEYTNPVAVAPSGPKVVELVGWNIPDDLRRFPIAARDAPGTLRLFDPRIANPFSVRVETLPCTLRSKEKVQSIVMPMMISGRLDRPGDCDVYEVKAKKGEKLSFRVASPTLGFQVDPVLRLTDAAGKTLLQTKAAAIGADAALDYTAPQEGMYHLEVSDLHRGGGFRFVYRLQAGPLAPDFELKVASDNFRQSLDKPLEIPVTITRVGGFNQDVTLSVEGAPKEIAVAATAKGVSLRQTAKTTFAGPIRIVGAAKDGVRRTAVATIPETARTTESLWLSSAPRQD